MKKYESVSRIQLTPRSPVIIRVDGRAFHTFTRKCQKPFDTGLIQCMVETAEKTAKMMQGFKLAFIQSDEASFLLTDFDDINTEGWFGYVQSKMVSIAASTFTAHFINSNWFRDFSNGLQISNLPTFDARAFVVPEDDVSNYFLWRAKDWERNSLSMYCQSLFSHKQLMHKNANDQHDMLHSIGKNWATDLTDTEKNGTFIIHKNDGYVKSSLVKPTFESINEVVELVLMGP